MEVYNRIRRDLSVVAWMFFLIYAGMLIFGLGKDDTDSVDRRSNMKPHVDARTGCQYLSVAGGGITPRLNAQGEHICGGE